MTVLDLTIQGDPVPKARPRLARNGGTYTPSKTRAAEELIAWCAKPLLGKAYPSTGEFAVWLTFGCKTRRRSDLDNLAKTVLDALNGVVWADDSQVVELHAQVVRGAPEPSTRIRVEAA